MRRQRRIGKLWSGSLVALLAFASTPAWALVESFGGSAPGPGWTLSGDAILTGDGVIDPAGSGWLRLNPVTGGMGFAYHTAEASTAAPITASFDFAATGGSDPPADGLTFFLFDASSPFAPGDGGGSYGYQGMPNGALAIGVDDGYGSGFVNGVPDAIGVAGPAPGTGSIANSGSLSPRPWTAARGLTPADPNFRRLTIELTPAGAGAMSVRVDLQRGGSVTNVLNGVVVNGLPPAVRFGFSAATGGAQAQHEVRNVSIAATRYAGIPVPATTDAAIAAMAAALLLAGLVALGRR